MATLAAEFETLENRSQKEYDEVIARDGHINRPTQKNKTFDKIVEDYRHGLSINRGHTVPNVLVSNVTLWNRPSRQRKTSIFLTVNVGTEDIWFLTLMILPAILLWIIRTS